MRVKEEKEKGDNVVVWITRVYGEDGDCSVAFNDPVQREYKGKNIKHEYIYTISLQHIFDILISAGYVEE